MLQLHASASMAETPSVPKYLALIRLFCRAVEMVAVVAVAAVMVGSAVPVAEVLPDLHLLVRLQQWAHLPTALEMRIPGSNARCSKLRQQSVSLAA